MKLINSLSNNYGRYLGEAASSLSDVKKSSSAGLTGEGSSYKQRSERLENSGRIKLDKVSISNEAKELFNDSTKSIFK